LPLIRSTTLLLLCASGCAVHVGRAIPDATGYSLAPTPAADSASLVVFRDAFGAGAPVLMASDGTPLCQLPTGTQCVTALNPGRHRVYVVWTALVVDALDLDVVAGKTYFATLAAPRTGWDTWVSEKFTPASKHWERLAAYRSSPNVAIAPARMAELRDSLGNVSSLISQGDSKMARYDPRHVEAHTLHPDDSL
jgi:hypothetical protein